MKHLIFNNVQNTVVKRGDFITSGIAVPGGTATVSNSSSGLERYIGYEVQYFNAGRTEFLGLDRVDYRNLSGLELTSSEVYRMIIQNSANYDANKLSLFTDYKFVPASADWINTTYHFINPPVVSFEFTIYLLWLSIDSYQIYEQPTIDLTYNHK